MAERFLVGGGTGFIGKQLVYLLRGKGHNVTVISRKQIKSGITWEDISKNGLPNKTNSVINLAGENVLDLTKRWNETFKTSVYKSRVDTTRLLAQAIDAANDKPKSFVTISGVGIYPPSDSIKYDEETSVKEYDFLSKLCHDWENASKLKVPGPCRLVNIRSGVVIGREGGMINNLYLPYFFGLGGVIGNGKQFLPWIHIEDLIQLIYFCAKNIVSGVINGVAPIPATNAEFTKAFASALNRPAVIPAPSFVFDILFGKERAAMLTKGQIVIPKRTLESGFQYKYLDIEAACKASSYMMPKKFSI